MKKLLRLVKRVYLIIIGRDMFFRIQKRVNTEKHGEINASWVINPDKINQNSVIFSFGIGYDISFDLSIITKFNVHIHAFDPTPRSIQWLREQELPNNFHYYEYGIADFDGKVDLFPPDNPEYISHTMINNTYKTKPSVKVQMYRLKTVMEQLHHPRIDLLKMDIEGAEYAALKDILSSNIEVDQILIEFHHRFNNISVSQTKDAIDLLNSKGYQIFYISPFGEEFSFIRNQLI